MNPHAALREYGKMVLRVGAVHRAIFDNKLILSFFAATPGLNEWAMLGKAWYHTTEKRDDNSWRFDTIILDAPATGHGLDMLRGPNVIVDVAPPGLLRREATRAWKLFSDPQKSGVVVVTLAEEMPVTETLELIETVRGELNLPIAQVIVNDVLPSMFSDVEAGQLLMPRSLNGASGDEALAAAARRARRESIQGQALSRLRDNLDLPVTTLPHLFEELRSPESLGELAKRLT